MRKIENSQMGFGEAAIGEIDIDAKSRDDIPALLRGIQHIYTNRQIREKIFSLLQEQVRPGIDLKVGRPGMDLWRVFVLAVVKQGLGCDYDRLQDQRVTTSCRQDRGGKRTRGGEKKITTGCAIHADGVTCKVLSRFSVRRGNWASLCCLVTLMPAAKVGHAGLYRDLETLIAVEYNISKCFKISASEWRLS